VPEENQESSSPAASTKPRASRHEHLGDFTTTLRVVPISFLAMAIGVLCAFVALALLRLIGSFTNLSYFGRWNTAIAHAFTVLTLKRSILTEKVARRGYHLSREYAVDPLEILFVREVMRSNVVVLPADTKVGDIVDALRVEHPQKQRLFPVVDVEGKLVGVLTRKDIRERIETEGLGVLQQPLADLVRRTTVETDSDEILRAVVYRMAEKGVTRLPVIERATGKFVGLVSLDDLLKARAKHLEEERRRERTLNFKFLLPGGRTEQPAK
jgi:CBS domain-containing protein